MATPPRAALAAAALAWLAALVAAAFALERPAPLFVNLGAGDGAFARGFRGGWERDGLRGSGETMFRWTLDGSRLELPVDVRGGRPAARMRLARFAPGAAELSVLVDGRERDRWTQPSVGWRVREIDLGETRGPLTVTFRSRSEDPEGLGVAVDWVEITGAGAVVPRPELWGGLALMLIGVPALIGLMRRSVTAVCMTGGLVTGLAAVAIFLDRLGGLVGVARAGPACGLALIGLALAAKAQERVWPDSRVKAGAFAACVCAACTALLALSHPFYYYPDVDTHARYLAAARADPRLFFDPALFQARTGAWTREIGGQRVAFPYSSVFHLMAWPAAVWLGEVAAVKTLAVLALGVSVLLVHALARALGLGPKAALLAQALFALMPVASSRLVLALFPTLLGQALELLLIVVLARTVALDGKRQAWTIFVLLLAAQAAYTGSLINVAAVTLVWAVIAVSEGDGRTAPRLLALYAAAAAAVVAAQYARFVPIFWSDVLPHVAAGGASAEDGTGGAGFAARVLRRWGFFYDVVFALMLGPGLYAVRRAPRPARRATAAALAAGLALLVARYAAPALLRDAKEVELLAAPLAVLSAAAAAWSWRRGTAGRALALGALLWALAWGAMRAAEAYAGRFLAVGR